MLLCSIFWQPVFRWPSEEVTPEIIPVKTPLALPFSFFPDLDGDSDFGPNCAVSGDHWGFSYISRCCLCLDPCLRCSFVCFNYFVTVVTTLFWRGLVIFPFFAFLMLLSLLLQLGSVWFAVVLRDLSGCNFHEAVKLVGNCLRTLMVCHCLRPKIFSKNNLSKTFSNKIISKIN